MRNIQNIENNLKIQLKFFILIEIQCNKLGTSDGVMVS